MTYTTDAEKSPDVYNDSNIKQRYRMNEAQRIRLLCQIISQNPDIHHTHVLKIALEYGESKAKKTYEDLLNKLEKNRVLVSIKDGESPNAPRLWRISNDESLESKQLLEHMKEMRTNSHKRLDTIISFLPKLSDYEKAFLLVSLLKNNNELLLSARFYSSITGSKEVKELERYEKRIHAILTHNKNCLKFLPQIFDLYHKETLKSLLNYSNMYSNNM